MSNQPKPAEIEDVLLSIRRLVAGDDPLPDTAREKPEPPGRDALLLTQAQRVRDGAAPATEDKSSPAQPADWLADAEADAAASRAGDRAAPVATDGPGAAAEPGTADAPGVADVEVGAAPDDVTSVTAEPQPEGTPVEREAGGALAPESAELSGGTGAAAEAPPGGGSVDSGEPHAPEAGNAGIRGAAAAIEDTPWDGAPDNRARDGAPEECETGVVPEVHDEEARAGAALAEELQPEEAPPGQGSAGARDHDEAGRDAGPRGAEAPEPQALPVDPETGSAPERPAASEPDGPRQGFGFGEARRREDPVRHVPLSELPWPATSARVSSKPHGFDTSPDAGPVASDPAPAGAGAGAFDAPGVPPEGRDPWGFDIANRDPERADEGRTATESDAVTDPEAAAPAGFGETLAGSGRKEGALAGSALSAAARSGAPHAEGEQAPGTPEPGDHRADPTADESGSGAFAPDLADAALRTDAAPATKDGSGAAAESGADTDPVPFADAESGAPAGAGALAAPDVVSGEIADGDTADGDKADGDTADGEGADADERMIADTMNFLSGAGSDPQADGARDAARSVEDGTVVAVDPGPDDAPGPEGEGHPARDGETGQDAAHATQGGLSSPAQGPGQMSPSAGHDGALGLFDAGAAIDEAALRALITDTVHRELQGVLGERVSHNIRSLVRREIARALEARDLD